MLKLKEAIERIKESKSHRISPLPDKKVKIEILTEAGWVTVLSGLHKTMAEDVLRQATDKVILG